MDALFEDLEQLSVFIVPTSGAYYPFNSTGRDLDQDTYKIVSQHLRLLSKRISGVIFGAIKDGDRIVVRALDFKNNSMFAGCLPVVPLEKETYKKLFETNIEAGVLKKIFKLDNHRRLPGAANQDPYKAFESFFEEAAFYQLKNVLEEKTDINEHLILTNIETEMLGLSETEGIHLAFLALFLFTFNIADNKENVDEQEILKAISNNIEFANELSEGLRQIAQNVLQHSSSHKGMLSLYLAHESQTDVGSTFLHVLVSDYNDSQSFIENFTSNLTHEAAYTKNPEIKQRYLALAAKRETISLANFFGEYGAEGPDEAWINFRTVDTSAHIGLILFSLIMQRCKGKLSLKSSTSYIVGEKNTVALAYDEDDMTPLAEDNTQTQYGIPGTQLKLTIPVRTIDDVRPLGLGQLHSHSIQENYSVFARYLDFKAKQIKFSLESLHQKDSHSEGGTAADANQKNRAICCWEEYWLQHNSIIDQIKKGEGVVYYFDLSQLTDYFERSVDRAEIFIKGFLNAIDYICRDEQEVLWAFTNAPVRFFQTFRRIVLSLATKRFPLGLQLYIVDENLNNSLQLLGETYFRAIENAYTLSLEYGLQALSYKEVKNSRELYLKVTQGLWEQGPAAGSTKVPLLVCPFDTVLLAGQGDENSNLGREEQLSIFDARILKLAKCSIDEIPSGYKLANTHMRLGSKVHIRAFYEMAILFYRTSVANRIAFEMLRSIKDYSDSNGNKLVNLLEDDLLFFGYASYSKALTTSVREILREYREIPLRKRKAIAQSEEEIATINGLIEAVPSHIARIFYQHNLQSELPIEETELNCDFYDDQLCVRNSNKKIDIQKPITLIQIVPISTTLTTFDKIEARLIAELSDRAKAQIKNNIRYTVFWVTDKETVGRENEKAKYWTKVETNKREITPNPEIMESTSPITYFMRTPVIWEDPLKCELCYPDDVIGEVPLVDTDPTSTVPAQQIRGRVSGIENDECNQSENDQRLLDLKSCVSYGHIQREKNHFQFYIETQKYFNKVHLKVKDWLINLRQEDAHTGGLSQTSLHVIFSPEHTTNVGFAQYVNNYYFEGMAEIVCINEDKEFRSNFKCEHTALIQIINELLSHAVNTEERPVSFYFVDDTIISGETFHKANNFLHSLLPDQYCAMFPVSLFKKCFLLVDRLSKESKKNYVQDVDRDFYSFL